MSRLVASRPDWPSLLSSRTAHKKAAYFAMVTAGGALKTEFLKSLEDTQLSSLLEPTGKRTYPGNTSSILAVWDGGMVEAVREPMLEMLKHVVRTAVDEYNSNKPEEVDEIVADQLKLRAYGVMAAYMRDTGALQDHAHS
ncbi:hypothetical protein N0V85_005698 [Neurospora sp. IMI 360204]|nr:hypothetical protein N0V85_005698 [Neurospora sp. IMI 360204]